MIKKHKDFTKQKIELKINAEKAPKVDFYG
jgi:hypothetical protein